MGARTPKPTAGSAAQHHLVTLTLKSLEQSKPDTDGIIRSRYVAGRSSSPAPTLGNAKRADRQRPKRLDVEVSKASIARAMAIWDYLLKDWESRGWEVEVEEENFRWSTWVIIDEVSIPVRMFETVIHTKHVRTPEEEERVKRNPWLHNVPYEHVNPSGLLFFGIVNWYGVRRKRGDDQRGRLEDKIGKITEIMEGEAKKETARAEAAEQFQQAVEERRKARAEEKKREEEEQARLRALREEEQARLRALEEAQRRRIERLRTGVDSWRFASQAREYLAALRAAFADSPVEVPSADAEWLKWADEYIDSIDPIKKAARRPTEPS